MPLATYKTIWISSFINSLNFPRGNPGSATAKSSFVQSIVNGLVEAFENSEVKTQDSGTSYSGAAGKGTGSGMSGFNSGLYSSKFISLCNSKFKNFTSENSTVMNTIADTFKNALNNVSIETDHPSVTMGSGIATLTRPSESLITSKIYSNAVAPVNNNQQNSRWYDYSEIIAKSIYAGCVNITGNVQITGAVTPIAVPVPSGIGSGKIK